MDKMKILVLVHESLVPPEKPKSKQEWEEADWKTEYDVVHALRDQLGHKVFVLGVGGEIAPIRKAIEEFKPRIVFNLLEEFAGEAIFDQHVVSYLEMQGIRYTGSGPRGLMLARDKALAKKLLMYHRIPTPKFYVFKRNRKVRIPAQVQYPLFVKTLNEEASLGITQNSIVRDDASLRERIQHFQQKYDADVIAETFIEGRELYVGVVGNEKLKVYPPWELHFKNASDRVPRIATSKVKWDFAYRKKLGIGTGPAKGLDERALQKINNVCKRAYRALDISGYARMDLRLNDQGNVFLIEANPNPDIGYHEDLADSAEAEGIKYPELLTKILRLGLSRTR